MNPISNIIEQHAEEAAFNWILRDKAVHAPHYRLKDLADLDERVEAHIDGLRIAQDAGWDICKDALFWEEAGEVFAAAVIALESGIKERIQTVLETATISPEISRGFISALGWVSQTQSKETIQMLSDAESSDLRRIGIAACAITRQNPGDKRLKAAFSSEDVLLRSRAIRAVGELGMTWFLPDVKQHLTDKDDMCRFYAAWSSALHKDKDAVPVLCSFAESGKEYAEKACMMAVRIVRLPDAHKWLEKVAKNPELQRIAIKGIGAAGDPVWIPYLIEWMKKPEFARVAGEAFSMITGVDIAYEDVEGEIPKGFEAGPTEDPEDEDVETDPDEDLAFPDPVLIAKWWNTNRSAYQNGARYLLGKPVSEGHLKDVLRKGFQRQRACAAIWLAMIQGKPLIEVRAPGFRQR